MRVSEAILDELVEDARVEGQDWEDVLARSSKSKGSRNVGVAMALTVVGIAIATPALGVAGRLADVFDGSPVDAERISERDRHALSAMASGVSPRIPASKEEDMARLHAASIRQIAVRDGRAYFVADRAGGGLCVSVASVGDPDVIGSIACTPDFPSESRPILDRSIFAGPIAAPNPIRLEGFAADGITGVGLLTASGSVESVTPVVDNVYLRTEGFPAEPTVGLVALDAERRRVFSTCLVNVGCPIG